MHQNRMIGILEYYCLHSIKESPKSGYDILKEISTKSNGAMIISKGNIYPLLDNLENKNILKVEKIEARGKKIFSLTDKGIKYLKEMDKKKRGIRNKMKYVPIIFTDFKNVHSDIDNLWFKMYLHIDECSEINNDKVKIILEDCIRRLKEIQDDSN
ncbi:MAG TPA: PadR family transcriptional regulator [Methanofastidiosum sp.]|jgi:DNA-binding PadR family transcriptional regulator|nr:PadR family transcriptional regulator [Methanofastidiosum sp.]HPX24036.1 PadR family transcriptional regulator [Methanofastidiosum sp.]HQC25453.1 PadR family transcriptional regulator [Methanofastidiosum sp.]